MTSKDFIHRLREKENAAWSQLLADHHPRVYRVVLSFVRQPDVAEDLSQEVFIEAINAIQSFREDAQLSTWLHRIAVHRCLDYKRAQKRQKRQGFVRSLFNDLGELEIDPADTKHPGVILEDRERAALLFAAIDRLPEQQRIAYTLCKVDSMSVKEAAELMHSSPKAVESLLSRARSALEQSLSAYYRKH